MSQLTLFDPPAPPTFTMSTVCEICGAHADVEVEAGESWQPAMQWGYIALMAHRHEAHPDRFPPLEIP